MRLKKLEISNFKGFRKFSIEFPESVTVLIGKNGCGKTTLVEAIKKSLSFLFTSDKKVGRKFISAGVPGLNIATFDTADFYYERNAATPAVDISLKATASFGNVEKPWELYKRNFPNSSLFPSKYRDAFVHAVASFENSGVYPVLAYYSDSFPHREKRLSATVGKIIAGDTMPRNFGYYQWDADDACISVWEKRLCTMITRYTPTLAEYVAVMSEKNRLEYKSAKGEELTRDERELLAETTAAYGKLGDMLAPYFHEVGFVSQLLQHFSGFLRNSDAAKEPYFIQSLSAQPSPSDGVNELCLFCANGKTIPFRALPAGYRRLFSIVLDLAYRMLLLAGPDSKLSAGLTSGPNTLPGIAIIDEIDLHLHPSLEENVLKAFQILFPNLQFIITTHSAAVVSNLNCNDRKLNRIYAMSDGNEMPEEIDNVYGLPYNAVLRDFMDASSRNSEIKELEDRFKVWLAHGLADEARAVRDKMAALAGEESESVARLDALLTQNGANR